MTYDEAVTYLNACVNYERQHDAQAMRAVPLDRMRRLCQRLGDPQRRFRSVLVTGTSGKGSICAMLYLMLRESPLRIGLYASPHVEGLRERIRVWASGPSTEERTPGDDWIPEAAFASIVEQLQPIVEDWQRESPEGPLTYFELLTAIALVYFNQQRVQIGVLEVGLGGRLDATNIVEQAVSVIAPIDLDHTDVLGETPEAIAQEKAGILKPRQTVISAPQSPEVMAVLQAACDAQGIPLIVCGRELTVGIQQHSLDGLRCSITGLRGVYDSLTIPLLGRHQAQNAAVAIGALEALSSTGVPYAMVQQGLERVEWPGRLEMVHENPVVVLDGAHNSHAAAALRETLSELFTDRRFHLLIGMSSDKSVEAIAKILGPFVVSATCTASHHPRAMDPTELATRLSPCCPDVHVMSDPVDAYTYLLNAVSPDDVLVVTGSLFLVVELRTALRQSHVRPRRRTVAPLAAT